MVAEAPKSAAHITLAGRAAWNMARTLSNWILLSLRLSQKQKSHPFQDGLLNLLPAIT
jgi:hypothetical protein